MHIPDGFLAANTWGPAWVFSAAGLGYCLKKISATLEEKMVPLMGVMAAFIFAAQMLNFPVGGGTSGHLLGGVLATVLLGPYAGAVVIAVVLVVQCVIFQDGGLSAMGANILNMSFVGAVGGYGIYRLAERLTARRKKAAFVGVWVAAWFSVVLASAACAVELAISGTSPLRIALPAMVLVYMFVGIGEASISCLVIGFVSRTRPDLIYKR